jgi:hypothetical protein
METPLTGKKSVLLRSANVNATVKEGSGGQWNALGAATQPARLDLRPVGAETAGMIPTCAECGALWLPDDEKRWSAYHTDDEPPEVVFYCPECAEREFGND